VLTHLENAYLTDDLRKGLKALIENEELRLKLAGNVRKLQVYTWEEVAGIYIRILEQIMDDYHG
jgi:glycosyltransferase involved in cell wall biosynthesis